MSPKKNSRTKYIFITGGVVSSLGKGIVAASLGALLEKRGLRVTLTKADPYINIDPGTMNPLQHGEVFVTDDGAETDLDLGHYERFTSARLTRKNSFSTGQVYDSVLGRERRGDYLGGTVQVIPHITDQIKENMYAVSGDADVSLIEIGGTVGDIEGQPFLESIRQMRFELGDKNVLFVHLTLVPYISAAKELKTKPTQHSVKELRSLGIQPDILCLRADREVSTELRQKIARSCNVAPECVINVQDVESIYQVPILLNDQGLDQIVADRLNIWTRPPELDQWRSMLAVLEKPKFECRIAVVGKYVGVVDAYKSIGEALVHAGIKNNSRVVVTYVDSEDFSNDAAKQLITEFDGIIVPGGFGNRGVEGKIAVIQAARETKKPFFGICLGMQLAAVEFARNVLNLSKASSEEFEPVGDTLVIHLMDSQKDVKNKGASMRLGAYPCHLSKSSKSFESYGTTKISERHRHRFEFNNDFRPIFEKNGIEFSGLSPDGNLVEIMEIRDHPWFVACQFHPELKSGPMAPHPLFSNFVKSALKHSGREQI